MPFVYKICSQTIWNDAVAKGEFAGATIDLTDGFIHLSTASQAPVTAALYFKTDDDLVLVEFDDLKLKGLKYEPSRGGELFPHVFGTIDPRQALNVVSLPRQHDGSLKFPDGFQ